MFFCIINTFHFFSHLPILLSIFSIRKLLKEHHLDAVTKVAQLEESERLKRLDQQRINLTVAPELVYTHTLGNKHLLFFISYSYYSLPVKKFDVLSVSVFWC